MALIKPILGAGFPYLWPLRGNREFFDPSGIETRPQVDLKFFSVTGDYIGIISTGYDQAPSLKINVIEDKIGGLINFSFTIPRNFVFPFYNLMETQIFINQIHWHTGELQFLPNQDRRDVAFSYAGKGYVDYLKKNKINIVYQNETLKNIIIDLIENQLQNTPVNYNQDLINVEDYTLTKFEANDTTIYKALIDVLGYANQNYNSTEYRFGVNLNKDFFFLPMSNSNTYHFFEGFDFQQPDTMQDSSNLKNKIDIYRSIEDSDQVQYVSTIEDTESQALYGLAQKEILLSNFFDTTTAENIAKAQIEKYKKPLTNINLENLKINTNPFPFEKYYISNSRRQYTYIISECESTSDWDLSLVNTTLTTSDEKVFTGKKTFKIDTTIGSEGEYFEISLEDIIYFPEFLTFYISQNTRGQTLNIIVYDQDGNANELSQVVLELNNGNLLQLNNGKLLQLNSSASGIDIKLLEEFQKQTIDISSISNVEKIRFLITTNEDTLIYLDRVEIQANQYNTNKIFPKKFTYLINNSTIVANAEYGEETINVISDIKELSDKQENIKNIFEKGS